MKRPSLVIGVAGGSGSGKSTFCDQLTDSIGEQSVTRLSHDDYYHDLSELGPEERAQANFDSPDSLESQLLAQHLGALSTGDAVETPVYDFSQHIRRGETRRVAPSPVILAEGILLFCHDELRAACDLLVFVDADEAIRYERRLQRDVRQRGRTEESVQLQWSATVRPMYEKHVEPSRQHADLIVPMNRPNVTALELVVAYVMRKIG